MKTRHLQITGTLCIACFVAIGASAVQAAPVIGFLQETAGPWDYSTAGNWVGGDINGLWDSSLTLPASQTVTFDADTVLSTGLSFLYDGSGNVTLRADGTGERTLTLGGDVLVNTVGTRTISFGSNTGNQKLNVDLGGVTRTFNVIGSNSGSRVLTFLNGISNGSVIIQGGGTTSLNPNTVTSYSLTDLTLKNGVFSIGNNKAALTVSNALTFDGVGGVTGNANTGGIGVFTLSASGTAVTAGSLQRANHGVGLIRGNGLGGGSTSLKFTSAPTLIGGNGAAGTTNISIIPWVISGNSTTVINTFATYDAANGVRPLDIATEYVNSVVDGSTTTDNFRLLSTSGSTVITSNTTVNSLFLEAANSGTPVTLDGPGTLTVTSGAVFISGANTTTVISTNLNFGNREGLIGFWQGKSTSFTGTIDGTAGLTFYQYQPYATLGSPGTATVFSGNAANSTYTGDTYILSRVNLVNSFLPHGTRTGDVYVNGILETSTNNVNGLNGTGLVNKAGSGYGTLSIGDNDADGDFAGVIAGQLHITKIGNGTQIFGGDSGYTGATTVSAGKLIVNGSILSNVSVSSGATLGGSGATGNVTVADGGHVAPGNSPGTLHTAAMTLGDLSLLDFQLGSLAGPNDLIDVAGALTLDGILNVENLGGFGAGQYLLISYSGSLTDNTLMLGVLPAGFEYSIDTATPGSVFLNVMIPEPATAALLGLGGLLLAGARKRRA